MWQYFWYLPSHSRPRSHPNQQPPRPLPLKSGSIPCEAASYSHPTHPTAPTKLAEADQSHASPRHIPIHVVTVNVAHFDPQILSISVTAF